MEKSLDTALDTFLNYLVVERGLMPNTVAAYGGDLRRYLDTLESLDMTAADQVTEEAIDIHMVRLSRASLRASSRARTLSAIKQFHRFLAQEGIAVAGPRID